MNTLSHYVHKFSRLRVAVVKGARAPHKPILLLAIMESLEKKFIITNRICIDAELVATFKDYWHQLVKSSQFTPNFSLPFYHLQSDGFWHLQTLVGREIALTSSRSIRSFGHLKEVVDYAWVDETLFQLLQNNETRSILRQAVMRTYFPEAHLQPNQLIGEIINQILHEPAAAYKTKAAGFDEEEVFVRSGIFKKEIPKIYNYTCAISEMRIVTDTEVQMIDACHIVPFSESHDDTITNGISLCPNLHRAFDRGLISIDDDYSVLVKSFAEKTNRYSIKQFEGKRIVLPGNDHYFPSRDNLAAHRKRHAFY